MTTNKLPDRDANKANNEQGLYRKFDVRRTDGSDKPGGKHHGCEYFVLDVQHDPLAKAALTAYADAAEATHPQLSADLRVRYTLTRQPVAGDGDAKNAARYRWLRDEESHRPLGRYPVIVGRFGDELDASIDAAMSKPTGPAQGDGADTPTDGGEGS